MLVLHKAHPPETNVILMGSDGGDGLNRSDMHDPHTEANEVRLTSEQLVTVIRIRTGFTKAFHSTGQCFHSAPSGISGGAFRSLGSSQDTRHCGRRQGTLS